MDNNVITEEKYKDIFDTYNKAEVDKKLLAKDNIEYIVNDDT